MTSIPFDPTLTLGDVVEIEKMENLKAIATAQKPLDVALERLNNVLQTQYSLRMVLGEMKSMKLPQDKLDAFQKEMDVLEQSVVAAAVDYGEKATKSYQAVEDLLNKQGEKTISYGIESPVDFNLSKIQQFPLAFDALEFDVQYVRKETNDQKSGTNTGSNHADDVSKSSSSGLFGLGADKHSKNITTGATHAITAQNERHDISGTIVITARADQKNADIFAPLILDPVKLVAAWNYTFPDDVIQTDSANLYKTAIGGMKSGGKKDPSLDIISGCSKSASFVGFVHLLKTETTKVKQVAKSTLEAVKKSMDKDAWLTASSGGFGVSKSFSETNKSLTSNSHIENHASIVCEGIIPSIVCNEIPSMVKKMAPDASKIMEQQAAISDASNSGVNKSVEGETEGGKKGAQFTALNSDYMKNSVQALSTYQNDKNKVIDINSMMTAFEDFVNKAMTGGCGVPKTFYIKSLKKCDVAKVYIRKFYPNGASTAKDRSRGALEETGESQE